MLSNNSLTLNYKHNFKQHLLIGIQGFGPTQWNQIGKGISDSLTESNEDKVPDHLMELIKERNFRPL